MSGEALASNPNQTPTTDDSKRVSWLVMLGISYTTLVEPYGTLIEHLVEPYGTLIEHLVEPLF